ncbi:hypothetical protein ANN_08316 [Periplaneta americana]|uniref:GIY-YIG domain-containing protein n=1 Tax=Periplaneta americana TaxID=6978 RepID=A0ABQ8T2F6_PERAM|nr:hypothetical protein ANN_08316 [Periplaneta americana]
MGSKRDKFGIKFWLGVDTRSKYLVNGFPYLGRDVDARKGCFNLYLYDHPEAINVEDRDMMQDVQTKFVPPPTSYYRVRQRRSSSLSDNTGINAWETYQSINKPLDGVWISFGASTALSWCWWLMFRPLCCGHLQSSCWIRNNNNIIRKSTYKNSRPEAHERDPELMNMKQKAFLPYIEGTTDRTGKLLRKFNIKMVYNAPHKISHSLVKVKDKLPYRQSAGIYMIPCSCSLKYIGQTGRTVEDRRKEHIRLCKYGPYEKSAIALHSADSGHAIEFDNIKLIDKEDNLYRRLVKEAFHIEQHPNNINKDEGLQLSNSWGSLFQDHT